jgi:hypothetical protein
MKELVNCSHRKKHMVEIPTYKKNMLNQVPINIVCECCRILPSTLDTKSRRLRDCGKRYVGKKNKNEEVIFFHQCFYSLFL